MVVPIVKDTNPSKNMDIRATQLLALSVLFDGIR